MISGAETRVAEKPEELAVKATMTFPRSDGGGLSFETYFGQDQPLSEVNSLMDKLHYAAKRQHTLAEIERERLFYYNDGVELDRMSHDLQVMDLMAAERANQWESSGRRGDYKAAEAEIKGRQGLVATIKTMQQRRERHGERIEQLLRELNEG